MPRRQTGRAQNKFQLGGIISRVNEGQAGSGDDFGKFAPVRTGEHDVLAQLLQSGGQLDALVVGPAAREEGIEMQNPQRRAARFKGGFHAGRAALASQGSMPRAQRIFPERMVSARRWRLAWTWLRASMGWFK